MNEYLQILKKTRLFSGLTDDEILAATECMRTRIKSFKRGEVIFAEGDRAGFIGVVLSGGIETRKTDYKGNSNLISRLNPSDLIAAVAAYSRDKILPFDVVCAADSKVLAMDAAMLIRPCQKACALHSKIIENMLEVVAGKNVSLVEKIDILTKRSIREKLLSYLYSQSKRAKSKTFSLPLNRRQTAEFLSVDRSALSRELCKMREAGLLEFAGNSFKLLD